MWNKEFLMKKFNALLFALTVILCAYPVFAQEDDDVPYLSDEDIAAIEMVLPDDVPEPVRVAAELEAEARANEISRLNSQPLYHLLVLDRSRCAQNSDIGGIDAGSFLYKLQHEGNGYLIVIYLIPKEGPVFPVLPDNSRIALDLMAPGLDTIEEYVNSSLFGKFVTNRAILAQIQYALRDRTRSSMKTNSRSSVRM
jgi:hypothetical protein